MALTAACLSLAACADTTPTESTAGGAATIEDIAGSALKRVTVTATAAKRLNSLNGVWSQALATPDPYSAVLYDPDGHTWAFAEKGPRSFVREPISVAAIDGDVASLTAGPPVGTR